MMTEIPFGQTPLPREHFVGRNQAGFATVYRLATQSRSRHEGVLRQGFLAIGNRFLTSSIVIAPRVRVIRKFCLLVLFLFCLAPLARPIPPASWKGLLRDKAGIAVADATIKLHTISGDREFVQRTSPQGEFSFADVASGDYLIVVTAAGVTYRTANPVTIKDGTH
jgi:hypothetical protein